MCAEHVKCFIWETRAQGKVDPLSLSALQADMRGCSPSCRSDPSEIDPAEMEVFVGVNPGFSLSNFEQEEKARKKQKTMQSKPNP